MSDPRLEEQTEARAWSMLKKTGTKVMNDLDWRNECEKQRTFNCVLHSENLSLKTQLRTKEKILTEFQAHIETLVARLESRPPAQESKQ